MAPIPADLPAPPSVAEVRAVAVAAHNVIHAFEQVEPVVRDVIASRFRRGSPEARAAITQFQDVLEQLRLTIRANEDMIVRLMTSNQAYRDEIVQLHATLDALGYSPQDGLFFTHIREAIAVCKAWWACRRAA